VSVITIRDLPARHALYCDGSKGRVWKVVWQVAWRAGQAVVGKGDQHVAPDRRHALVVLASVVVSTPNASGFEYVVEFRFPIRNVKRSLRLATTRATVRTHSQIQIGTMSFQYALLEMSRNG